MAESTNSEDIEAVREDLEAIKHQLASLMKHVGSATASKAGELCGDLRDEGAEALRKQVRELPITSVILAFVAGTVAANIIRLR
jgi:hypothetical protein